MPFKSEKQRRWMHANEPEMAQRWEHEEDMKDYHNSRNFPGDTYEEPYRESAVPFVSPDPGSTDPNPNSSWGSTGDCDFAATAMDVIVRDNGDVETRHKAGPANQSSNGDTAGI